MIQPCGNLCPLFGLDGCASMQSGEQCVPEILVDPCVEYSTAVQLTCPENNVNLWYLPEASDALPLTKCRVCGFGQVGQDQDHRKGYYESDIFFGQNSIESMITEDPIVEYRVYLVDAMNRRLTRVLAVVPKGPEEETTCCRADSYRAHIFTVLPPGYKRFMVVPVSNLGKEMPAGTVSDDVVDRERGAIYNLGTFPQSNFSFLVNVVNDMKVGNGSLMLQSPGHEVNIPCTRLRLLKRAAVVPVLVQLLPDELYQVLLDRDCLIVPSTNESVDLVSPAHGLHFQTEHENATENDIHGPRLLDAYATFPQNGALQSAREFHFFFNEVALRGPGALAVVRHSPTAVTVVDHAPTFRSVLGVPGMVVVRPRQLLEPGRHEVVFGPGAIQDALGNMAHSSKEFEERGEWEHRVACFFGDCGETPAFGLDDYVIQVPVEGAQAAQYPEAPWTSFPQPGELMFKHENVVLDFTGQVSPGDLENVIEFCSNWTTTDVCLMKRTIQLKDMLFVGSKVIINPPQDLDPGFSYNVSIQSGVVASFASVYADGSGRFAYNIQVRAEAPDRSAPVLVAVEVVCQSDDVNSSTIWNETDGFGCGAWLPAERINGEPPLWGFKGLISPVALPAADRGSVHIRFVFREPVLLELGAAAAPAVFLYTSETGSIRQEVPAFVGTEVEDSVVTAVPNLLPGHLYTLELGKGVIDTATWPEPNRFEEGVALTFFTYLTTPNISLASNDGLQEADPSSVIKLSFEGPAKLADPFSDLQAEIVQVNPMVDSPDRQQMLVSDPGSVVFFGHEVLFLPRRLLAGTSYRFTLPAGSVLHFDEPLSFLFTTRSQDLVAPSIVWTWPTQTLSKLQIDRMLVQIYFSEAVEATPGKFIILRDDRGMRHPLPVDRPCRAGLVQGCIQMDMEGRRLSLLPMGQSMTGEMLPWAGPGRTYMVDIEEDAFSDAGTVGELRKNLLKASSFSFSVYPDTDGPVLATSMPSNNSGDVEPVRDSILLVFDEVVQAVQSDFSVMSTSLVRPMEAPQLDMPPGEIAVNPGVGVITLAFNVDVEAGSGFFHIMVLSDTPTVRGNITEFDAELIKEVPVEEAFFVKNLVMLSPFPLSLDMNALFFVGANETAVVATNGVNLAMELSTWQEAQVQFRITPTLLGVVYSSWRDWRCFTKLTDVELYMNEHIIGLNTSDRAITLRDATGQMVWRLWADEMQTDANHLQVSLDPLVPFKATIHAGELPPNLPGGNSKPLPETGGVYMLEVDAGLFIDRPEEIQENVTVVVPVGATCGDFNFSCGPGRRHIDNATLVRCASRDACTELDDNLTCCEDVIVDMLNVTACINGSNCSNDTEELELTARRLMGLEPTLEIQTVTYLEVAGSPMLSVDFRVCETRYQDLAGRSARIYVPLEVKRSVITGRLRPQLFEAYIPTTAVQDVLGNVPQESAMISFAHDLQMPELDPFRCHPLNNRNATEQESIQLSFSEPVKAGSGFFELWDINDVTGPKIRIDVEMLAQPNRDFLGRKLIDGNVVSLFPDLLCVGGCLELGNDVTYFLVTRTPGVLYDMMDNPLPMLNTSNSWRFYVSENVTRAPEVLRVSYAFNITNYTVSGIPELQEVYGYVYFTQRIYLNNSFPGMTRMFSEIQIRDCGSNFDCSTFQAVEPMIFVEPWGSSQLGLEPGLAQFRFEAPMEARRFQVTVLSRSFMGADTSKGSMAGPLEPYTFLVDTGPDPRIQPDRPFILPGGVEPAGNKVPSKTNVTMVFSEEVLPGSGNISFCTQLMEECTVGLLADGSYATLDVSEALVERRQVTWITEEFAFGQTLHILIPEGLFISADARAMPMGRSSGEYSFTIREGDVVPPRVIAIEATERRNGMVQMIFSESVIFEGDHGRRGVLVLETEGRPVRFNATAHGAVVTVYGPFRTGEGYQLRHSVSPLMDIMRNYAIIVPLDAENFTISDDMMGPTVHLPNQQRVSVHDVFYIMFDEGVLPGQRYCQLHSLPPVSCGITCGRSNPLLINVSADVHHFEQGGRLRSLVQVDPGKDLLPGFGYHLQIDTGFVEDSVGNPCESVQQTYQVDLQRDLIPPQLLLATINGHGGPVPSFDQDVHGKGIELYFSEVLQTLPMDADETVVLHLLPSNGGDRCGEFDNACAIGQNCSFPCDYLPAQQGLSIAADALELRGAIVSIPSSRMPLLEYGRGYRLVVHLDLFTDLAGNMASAGQSHGLQEELVFRVAPAEAQSMKELMLVQSLPMDGQTMVPETTSLQLVFNMEVKAGSGDFVLLPVVQDQMDKSLVGTLECEDCNESNDTEMNGTNQSELDEVWHLRQDHSPHLELNLSNDTVMPWNLDANVTGAVRIPSTSCHIRAMTVTCTLPPLAKGVTYRIYWLDKALKDSHGRWFVAGPVNSAPRFRVIDMPFVFPSLLSLQPSSRLSRPNMNGHMDGQMPRRLDDHYALEPKPQWYAAKGAILALTFSTPMKFGMGRLRLVDCSPGNSSRCFDDHIERIPDDEVLSVEVSAQDASEYILLDGMTALVVSRLRAGGRHALRLETAGIFVDEFGIPLLPTSLEFWVQADDKRPPEIFMQAPVHQGEASTNSNITLFFSEALQADETGVINISDGIQEELINLSVPADAKGRGYVILRESMVIINPSLDFGYGRMVTVNFEPGIFKDLAGNPFPGLAGEEYVFYTAPSRFQQMAAFLRYPNFREPRFTSREGALLHHVNGTLLLFSGIDSNGNCLADTWVSRTGKEWSQVSGVESQEHERLFPLVAHSPSAVDKDGCIWVLGGQCNNDPGSLWKTCDIGRSWFPMDRPTPIPFRGQVPPKFPSAFRDHAMTILGGWQLVVVDASPGSSEAVWRFNSPTAQHVQRVAGEISLPFGLRREPKLLATSEGGLFLVGGHWCDMNAWMCNFNDVWFSPDEGESWHCKTKNYLAKDPSVMSWPGVGKGFNAVITQDDTIFVMAGNLPGSEEASSFVYESFLGFEDIYLSDSQPYFIMPGSTLLDQPPVPPQQRFTLFFGEEVRLAPGAMAYFHEQPGNYTNPENETNYATGLMVESHIMVRGKDLLLQPKQWLLPGRRYHLEIPAGHVQDSAGNSFGQILDSRFEVEVLEDFQAPSCVSIYPPNGRTGVEPWTRLTLTMSEDVFMGHGSLKVVPKIAYGATVELPVEHAVIVLHKVVFQLPPGQRYTPDMEYVVTMPAGLLRDRFGNEVMEQTCGRFSTLSGFSTTSNYSGQGLPMLPTYPADDNERDFPTLLASWPFNGATDVPPRPGLEVFLYFDDVVQWTSEGMVLLSNETNIMASIPTRDYLVPRNDSLLQLLPDIFAVKINFPPSAVLRPSLRYTVSLFAGSLEDTVWGNRSAEIRVGFQCLQNTIGNEGPKLVAADVSAHQLVPASKHIFRFWYTQDIVKTTDQKPPVQLEFPTGQVVEVPGESQNVSISRNVLTVTFPKNVLGPGGMVKLRIPRFIFVDVLQRMNNVIEGGGQPAAMEEELTFHVTPEDADRPRLNISHCYPPMEEVPTYEFPANGRIMLAFSEEVRSGLGSVTFLPRSAGTPNVTVRGHDAVVAGQFVMVGLNLLPGEVYNVSVDADAFLDIDGYSMESAEESYVFSTLPNIRFRQMGSQHWKDSAKQVPGGRFGASVTVDDKNRIFMLGGRTSLSSPLKGETLNDVWLLDTFKEVNCASAYEGETPCSRQRCEAGPDGLFNLGTQSFTRFVWRPRSVLGSNCITSTGHRRSELGGIISMKSLQCPCPTCTSHPGPPDGPALPSDMLNDVYVQDYTLVPSDDTRPLLCAPGMTPTGNFSCKLFDRYFAVFETPYPTCENSSCEEPPDVSSMEHFAAWDPPRSTDNTYCPNISASSPLPHGGFCAALCDPGWKVDDLFRCEQGKFQAPRCWKMTCPIPSSLNTGRLDCEEFGGPVYGATCNLLCQPGYIPSGQSTCQTVSTAAEAAPTFLPPVNCTPGRCGDYQWLTGATISYTSDSRDITATAMLSCTPGYFPAGSAFGLDNPVELRCGPVIQQENEPEVEWKLTYTGARAGLICAPDGMAVYDTVALLGSIQLTLILPDTLTKDSLCTQYKDRFLSDLGLALVMALSSAGQVPLNADAMMSVDLAACLRLRRRLSLAAVRRAAETLDTTVSFTVKVANDAQALQLQFAVTNAEASAVFKRVFSLSLMSSSGVNATGIETSRMTRDILYIIGEPDGTQVSVVKDKDNDTDNDTDTNGTGGGEEEDFLSSPVFIGLVAGGSSCCCCCCLVCCYLRRRYMVDVYADWEESEEEDFSDDNIVDVLDEKDD